MEDISEFDGVSNSVEGRVYDSQSKPVYSVISLSTTLLPHLPPCLLSDLLLLVRLSIIQEQLFSFSFFFSSPCVKSTNNDLGTSLFLVDFTQHPQTKSHLSEEWFCFSQSRNCSTPQKNVCANAKRINGRGYFGCV